MTKFLNRETMVFGPNKEFAAKHEQVFGARKLAICTECGQTVGKLTAVFGPAGITYRHTSGCPAP